ncbi:MAG: hypothetical protein XD58_1446 [Thermotoga sp. 50_1627]|nr:MAG: hypothetical protein XD58_1446 [Thermotoga sp. 50_1627]
MEEDGREKELQGQEEENLPTDQKKTSISKLPLIILIVLCSASLVTSLLTMFLFNHFINTIHIKLQGGNSLVPSIIKRAELMLSKSDYETAQMMILNALNSFPNNRELLNEYDRILSIVVSNVDDPQTVFGILSDGETLIIKSISEAEPSHFLNLSQILKLIRDKRAEYLENMVEHIWKLEEEGNVEKANLLIKNYAYIFSTSRELTANIMDLLLKRLERLSTSEIPSLNLAYITLEIAAILEESLAANTGDISIAKERIDKMSELVDDMERKEIKKEIDSLCAEMKKREQLYSSMNIDEAILSAKIQNLLAKAQSLVSNPLVEDSDRERIYEDMYRVQKALQEVLEEKKMSNLKDYNRRALEILKEYSDEWNTPEILKYAKKLGEIDTRYLFTEVNLYYNRVLSRIVEKLKEDDLKKFIDAMFEQSKRLP